MCPQRLFHSVFFFCFLFPSLSVPHLNSLSHPLSVCPHVFSSLPFICPSSPPMFPLSLIPIHLVLPLSLSTWLPCPLSYRRSLIWNAIKRGNNGMCLKMLEREKGWGWVGGGAVVLRAIRALSEVVIYSYTLHTHKHSHTRHKPQTPPLFSSLPSVHRQTAKVKAHE